MKTLLPLVLGVVFLGATVAVRAATDLPRSTPEAQGIPSAAILDFVAAADRQVDTIHSFMLVRHGHVVAEGWWSPYAAESPHVLFSLSKSFTSTAVGLAISDGKLSLDDPVLKFFPEDAPAAPSENLKAMRVRDLLTMSTGHHAEDIASFDFNATASLTKAFLALPVAHKPGTLFVYNTPATYMLSAIVQKVTGQTVRDYLEPRLFAPLGIEQPVWEASAQGVSLGGFGLSVRTGDIARFGQLYLQKGRWEGKQLIPSGWVETATARQVSNGSNPESDWDQGYGFQFWRCRHGFYRGDGAFGQFCIVMPELDAVLAITSGTGDMGLVMNLVWDKLVPAMQAGPLPANDADRAKLAAALSHLALPSPSGETASPVAAPVAGHAYVFPENPQKIERLALETDAHGGVTLVVRIAGADERIACGRNAWTKGSSRLSPARSQRVAASGAWTAADTYTAKLWFYETPFAVTLALRFQGDQLLLDQSVNVSFGPKVWPQIAGRRE
jgi:CubicO group peptidase (beta-lactamase class C family)